MALSMGNPLESRCRCDKAQGSPLCGTCPALAHGRTTFPVGHVSQMKAWLKEQRAEPATPKAKIRVRIADAKHEGLDQDGGRWYVTCVTHGELVQVESRQVAMQDARAAREANTCAEWCEACRAAQA